MKTRALSLRCPLCGSEAITYSCEPKCCFNHVCAACCGSFQTGTKATGEFVRGVDPPDPPPDACDPAAPCEKCESVAVYMLDEDRLACADCGAVLILELTEVSPA